MIDAETFIEVLLQRAEQRPRRRAFISLVDGENETSGFNFQQLDRRARAIGAALQQTGCVGQPVILAHPPGLEYVAALMGCFYAGSIATPVYPPRSSRHESRLETIIADTGAKLAMTSSTLLAPAQRLIDSRVGQGELQWLATDILPDELSDQWRQPLASGETLALLQYTSGSTTTPKGVMVNHANLLHNQLGLQMAFQQTEESIIVSWLPPYHDMGLIGNLLHSIYVGATCVIMSPLAFLQKPMRWIKAVSRYYATTSGGPNFAYDLCARKIDANDCQDLDLSNWSVAFNGSEQIQLRTIERFTKAFAPYGFRREAFRPCYGLAEATLVVSAQSKDTSIKCRFLNNRKLAKNRIVEENTGAEGARAVISCGSAIVGNDALIVNPDSLLICADREIGEIWVSGPSIARGYWNRIRETDHTFNARVSNTSGGKFLRTGDLGFMEAGELYVLGRLKELIIIRGLNHYPEDIEATVRYCHPSLMKGCGAVFALETCEEERLVIVQEVKSRGRCNLDEVAGRIRQAVNQEHGLQAHAVMLVKPGIIPKTSSGKIQRRECREKFVNGNLEPLFSSILTDIRNENLESYQDCSQILRMDAGGRGKALEEYLTGLVSQAAGMPHGQLRAHSGVSQVGLDSLKSAELVAQIEDDFGVNLPMGSFLQDQSIENLASQINTAIEFSQARSNSGASENLLKQISPRLSPESLTHPLSLFQERVWLISQLTPDNPALCLHQALHFSGDLDTGALSKGINAIVERHEALRTTLSMESGKLVQWISPILIITLPIVDLRCLDANAREAEALRISQALRHQRFDLFYLPLFELRLLLMESRRSILFLTLSHFIADGWSADLFAQDLMAFYQAFVRGGDNDLPSPLQAQYKDFSYWQRNHLQSKAADLQRGYWRKQLADIPLELDIPTDRPRPTGQSVNEARYVLNIHHDLLIALRKLSSGENVTLFVLLLSAFKILLYRFSFLSDITVSAPVAYRNRKEFRQLIGCFANRLLLRTRLQGNWTARELLQSVRHVALEAFDNQDIPLSQIEELLPRQDVRRPSSHPASQFIFQLYRVTEDWKLPELKVSCQGPDIQAALFDLFVVAQEMKNGLRISWLYRRDIFEPETIELLVRSYEAILEQFTVSANITLSDLPLPEGFYTRVEKLRSREKVLPIVIAATFTAEPLADSLEFWMRRLGIPAVTEFGAYGNVFQQLLDPDSIMSRNQDGVNIILVRLWDWRGSVDGATSTAGATLNYRHIERNAEDLVSALKTAAGRSASPYILGFCPTCGDSESTAFSERLEKWIESELSGVNGLHLITTSKLASTYPIPNPCQPYREALGQIPYRDEFFVALGTMLSRRIYALYNSPPKVIVLDCDMTLWKGICGEDGSKGIEFDLPSISLQRFMKAQSEQGRLLCLCSKNNEEDVIQVFERRPEMILRLEDLVAWRVNWAAKSDNLRSLSDELQLGLDSFVFIDDDPMECAEVQANCPEALTFQLPADRSAIPNFLNHVWAFDHLNETQEDRKRTLYYKQDKQRRQALKGATNLKEFLASLELKIEIAQVIPDQIPRVVQLIQRTNQFKIASSRRSEAEIKQLWQSQHYHWLSVVVRDRFGDYGLVGAVLFCIGHSSLVVDTLVISCRVLGRGVEHRIIAGLGEIAREQGLEFIEVPFICTKKNQPARDFLNSIGTNFQHFSPTGILFRFPVNIAVTLRYPNEIIEEALIDA